MDTIYADLIQKYGWVDVQPVLARLYPAARKSMSEYGEAYTKLLAIGPVKTRMRIVIKANESSTLGAYYEVVGRDGTLVKDWVKNEQARKELGDRLEEEQDYGLSYTDWDEIKGMAIDRTSLGAFPEKEIIAHVLVEITSRWHSHEKAREVLAELHAIKQGRRTELIRRQAVGRGDFLQVWSEKPNGEYHGNYAVYWERGAMIAEEGIMIDGNKEGVWTYWERNGKVKRQIRFSCDRKVEEKQQGPWWNGAEDHEAET